MLLADAGPVDDLIIEHVADTLTVAEALTVLDRRERRPAVALLEQRKAAA